MKKVELMFYKTNPSPKNTGLKHVLWEITDSESVVTYDWGFAMYDGHEWSAIDVPEGYTAKVHSWANTVNPEVILNTNLIIT